ncbi:nucleoid-associated protein [Noviherbaspirillum denitrificans]|uniref:Nucleoid-associated protein n=1 Tax=Noviherbaspirillum denitrificans TaxID=1968433 RepID=A0A254TFB7_9BURK|nr:nucleoid-associated protein [Noviherbaspirillum denitrificans]OWW18358.1 hypothetical protein AYR66_01180 [Noviherbaspirillum denitrificans]
MAFEIVHSVIHGFSKEPHQPVQNVVKKVALLDNTLPAVQSLVKGIATLLGKRANNQVWGRFGDDGREGPFPERFSAYANDLTQVDDFLSLTHLAVDQLAVQAGDQPLATGGHILFSLYRDEGGSAVLLVAMIKQKSGVSLDNNYVPVGIVEVDMSKLHQAAQIRVAHFIEDQHVEEDEEEGGIDRNYLSFLSQRANGQASAYFITALGCVVGISSARATDKIFEAVDAFFQANGEIAQYRRAAKERVTEYLHQQLGSNQPASLDDICAVLNRVVRPEHVAHLESVSEFMNGPVYKIPDEFNVHKTALKKHAKVTLESERLNIKFDRAILGTTVNSEICYDKQNKTLLIRNLSDGFIEKLDSTILNG